MSLLPLEICGSLVFGLWNAEGGAKGEAFTDGGGLVGSLELEVPEFVDLVQDPEDKSARLSIRDATAKQQKEMWGMFNIRVTIKDLDPFD